MHKFPITDYKRFSELPQSTLNTLKFSVYILDFQWNYLFVNEFVKANLGSRGNQLIGKNMWSEFKELALDPMFNKMRSNMENHLFTNITTNSPVTLKRQNIVGYALEDCYYFSVSILPEKEDLIHELRKELSKNREPFHPVK